MRRAKILDCPDVSKSRKISKPVLRLLPQKFFRKNLFFLSALLFFSFFSIFAPGFSFLRTSSFVYPDSYESNINNLWKCENSENYFGCTHPSKYYPGVVEERKSNGYLMIELSGGLNQQRTGIIDAVVVAKILNATLIVPSLDHNSYWKDSSNFGDIFDIDHFIRTLRNDVAIIKHPPANIYRGKKETAKKTVPRKSSKEYYLNQILPLLKSKKILNLLKFDFRLSSELEPDLQRLRCRVNYQALKFTNQITYLAEAIIQKIRSFNESYIALHLRFEKDMLAFSGCSYGFDKNEENEFKELRRRWKTLHVSSPRKERLRGKCPLTPMEMGLLLRALGFSNQSLIYIASGSIYHEEVSIAPLLKMFPRIFSKKTLLDSVVWESLVTRSAAQSAAVDFLVCADSDVFAANNRGNMAKLVSGLRRFQGHKRTITPHARKIASIMMNRNRMTWKSFASEIHKAQIGYMGEVGELPPSPFDFHEYPNMCICQKSLFSPNAIGEKHHPDDAFHDDNDDDDEIGSHFDSLSSLQSLAYVSPKNASMADGDRLQLVTLNHNRSVNFHDLGIYFNGTSGVRSNRSDDDTEDDNNGDNNDSNSDGEINLVSGGSDNVNFSQKMYSISNFHHTSKDNDSRFVRFENLVLVNHHRKGDVDEDALNEMDLKHHSVNHSKSANDVLNDVNHNDVKDHGDGDDEISEVVGNPSQKDNRALIEMLDEILQD